MNLYVLVLAFSSHFLIFVGLHTLENWEQHLVEVHRMAAEHATDIAGGIVAEVVVLLLLPCLGDNRRHLEIVDALLVLTV